MSAITGGILLSAIVVNKHVEEKKTVNSTATATSCKMSMEEQNR